MSRNLQAYSTGVNPNHSQPLAVLAERGAEALVGRARQGPRPVLSPPRHRRGGGRAHLRLRPRERPHPDLQPRRRVPARSGPTPSGRPHLVFDPQGRAYVSELWWHKGQTSQRHGPTADPSYGRVSVFDKDGRVLARWGTPDQAAPGSFAAPHGIAVDSQPEHLRGRGHLDLRGEPRAHARRVSHVPELPPRVLSLEAVARPTGRRHSARDSRLMSPGSGRPRDGAPQSASRTRVAFPSAE